jgi:hypothetical protein
VRSAQCAVQEVGAEVQGVCTEAQIDGKIAHTEDAVAGGLDKERERQVHRDPQAARRGDWGLGTGWWAGTAQSHSLQLTAYSWPAAGRAASGLQPVRRPSQCMH